MNSYFWLELLFLCTVNLGRLSHCHRGHYRKWEVRGLVSEAAQTARGLLSTLREETTRSDLLRWASALGSWQTVRQRLQAFLTRLSISAEKQGYTKPPFPHSRSQQPKGGVASANEHSRRGVTDAVPGTHVRGVWPHRGATLCWGRWESRRPRGRGRKDGAVSPTRARASPGGAARTEPRAREPPGCVLRAAPAQVGLTHRTEPQETGPVRPAGAGRPGVLCRGDRARAFRARRQAGAAGFAAGTCRLVHTQRLALVRPEQGTHQETR